MWNSIGEAISLVATLLGVMLSFMTWLSAYTREARVTRSIKRYAEALEVLPQGTLASQDLQKILDIKTGKELKRLSVKSSRKLNWKNSWGLAAVSILVIAAITFLVVRAMSVDLIWAKVLLFILAALCAAQWLYVFISYINGEAWIYGNSDEDQSKSDEK